MAIESMTGFARCETTSENATRFVCEIRSVNGKSLDVRLRLPPSFDRLELPIRQIIQRHIVRGNCQMTISQQDDASSPSITINERMIERLLNLSAKLEERHGLAKPSIGELLSIRGVMETTSEETGSHVDAALLTLVEATVEALKQSRANEGAALFEVLHSQLTRIEELVEAANADPSRHPTAIRQRLQVQLKLLMDSAQGFDEQRVTMEAALLATKADIREELDRLTGHVASARQLLASAGPKGRKLDFLAQEFNREANTLCSKSNALSLTTIGLELKAVVDQLREQVQNLE